VCHNPIVSTWNNTVKTAGGSLRGCEFADDGAGCVLVHLAVTWDGLHHTGDHVAIEVVVVSLPDKRLPRSS